VVYQTTWSVMTLNDPERSAQLLQAFEEQRLKTMQLSPNRVMNSYISK